MLLSYPVLCQWCYLFRWTSTGSQISNKISNWIYDSMSCNLLVHWQGLTLIDMTSERLARHGGGLLEPPYLSQPFMVRFSKFFCLVKACENRHWLLFHSWLPIVHHMAARRRRSDEGQSRQYFQGKNQISQFLSYINVIYLKRTHFSCRIQIQTKNIWFIIEKFEKIWIFPFLGQKRGWPGVFDG